MGSGPHTVLLNRARGQVPALMPPASMRSTDAAASGTTRRSTVRRTDSGPWAPILKRIQESATSVWNPRTTPEAVGQRVPRIPAPTAIIAKTIFAIAAGSDALWGLSVIPSQRTAKSGAARVAITVIVFHLVVSGYSLSGKAFPLSVPFSCRDYFRGER